MLNKEAKVQGVAIYAEFRRAGETMQIIVTPDAFTTTGDLVPMTLVRRVVTPETPKKQWRNTSLGMTPLQEILDKGVTPALIPDTSRETFTENRMRHATHYFDRIVEGNWEIQQKPILLEMSKHDADDLSKGKTPNKIIYRMNISRKALGFAEKLV